MESMNLWQLLMLIGVLTVAILCLSAGIFGLWYLRTKIMLGNYTLTVRKLCPGKKLCARIISNPLFGSEVFKELFESPLCIRCRNKKLLN